MNDLIKQVTPLTRAVIWIVKDECDSNNPHYADIDYLLDGLLTANLRARENVSSRLIMTRNFNRPLFVFVVKEMVPSEIASFVSLVDNDLGPENDILVLDETGDFPKMKAELKSISANITLIN